MFSCNLPPALWQNDRDFLRATVVTRGWNGYRNKSQHRKSTLEKKILPPFQQGFEPATFQSRVRCSNHWAIPAPGCKRNAWYHFGLTPSIAFRHLPPKEGCRKPVLGVCILGCHLQIYCHLNTDGKLSADRFPWDLRRNPLWQWLERGWRKQALGVCATRYNFCLIILLACKWRW